MVNAAIYMIHKGEGMKAEELNLETFIELIDNV